MWRTLARLARSMRNIRKSPRVADESMFNGADGAADQYPILDAAAHRGHSFSAVFDVVLAPLNVLSCFSQPYVSGADSLWLSGEFGQQSELNYHIVNDSMRYAILM
uniref:Uncharacterized protein n=1 Tax=Rhizophora mucronata TaxID=61149 RepID=A0A2P2PM67_RHIMU